MNASSSRLRVRRARARLDRAWAWLIERPGRGLAVALALGCALRLPFLAAPFGDDEGGYLYVAQHWSDGGHRLYGSQWVDALGAAVQMLGAQVRRCWRCSATRSAW